METSDQEINSAEQQRIKEFIEAFIEYLKGLGAFALKIGEIEKQYPHAIKMMTEMASPENLANFISKAPPKIIVKMFEFMLKASSLSVRMQKNFNELTADEKIEVGNEMLQLAKNAAALMREAEETEET